MREADAGKREQRYGNDGYLVRNGRLLGQKDNL
jgi:hypothetical protein